MDFLVDLYRDSPEKIRQAKIELFGFAEQTKELVFDEETGGWVKKDKKPQRRKRKWPKEWRRQKGKEQ